ncbi:MAG: hypothetical protein AB2693_32605, partial [Candidatus Thiodiazotropha sp.]
MAELPTFERAHRLGRFNAARGPRPIIVAFSFFKDTEDILSAARSLRGTPYGISRDFPPEITKARQVLWPQFKEARENPLNRVTIAYPAKLIVNGVIVSDLFPDWDLVMKGSRISMPKQTNEQINTNGTTYASVVSSQSNDYQHGFRGNSNTLAPALSTPSENKTEEMETQEICNSQPSPSILQIDDTVAGTDWVRDSVTKYAQNEGTHDCNSSNLSGSDKSRHADDGRRVDTDLAKDQPKENMPGRDR